VYVHRKSDTIHPLCIFIVHNLIQNKCKAYYETRQTLNRNAIHQTAYKVRNK